MDRPPQLTATDHALINAMVKKFVDDEKRFSSLLEQLISSIHADRALTGYIHSIKSRVKDPDHLGKKLERKLMDAKRRQVRYPITIDNLFSKINDLAGLRILHLHTKQFKSIHERLVHIFDEDRYDLIEGPIARTWDDESRALFKEMNIKTKTSPSMYTSVHYVIAPNKKARITCEIQVRTLAEELWGEVDHTINYPYESPSLACREQIKVLARVTSGCTRLVDSIFSSHDDYEAQNTARATLASAALPVRKKR